MKEPNEKQGKKKSIRNFQNAQQKLDWDTKDIHKNLGIQILKDVEKLVQK